MKDIQHVIWDWNGTLLDDVSACVLSLNDILSGRGLKCVSIEDYQAEFDFPVKSFYTKLGLNFEQEDWDALAREYHNLYGSYAENTPLRKGIAEVLDHISNLGIEMSVLSACETSILERMLKQREIDSYFRQVSGLHNLYAESKIDIGKELISTLPVASANTLLVGDTTHDFEVAGELNCHCILVAGGHQSSNRLEACGCPLVSEPGDITEWL